MPRKNPLTASRFLSSEIMKSPSWRGAVISIVKEGQRKGYSREWMISMISVLVVERMAARIEARHADSKWRRYRKEITGKDVKEVSFTVSDMKAASARLLRKVPMLEKCEHDPPGKFPARFDLFPAGEKNS
jgi:hypothetical protein